MWNVCAETHAPCWCPGMQLRTVWLVDQDASYQVPKGLVTDPCLVAVRTLAGSGAITLRDGRAFTVEAETLLMVEMRALRQYGTTGDHWQFSWWEFAHEAGVGYPWYQVLAVPAAAWEAPLVAQTFSLLGQPDGAGNAAASALFNALLHLWAVQWGRRDADTSAPAALVARATAAMQERLAQPLSMAALARDCGVSPRWLRQAFATHLGATPKEYHTQLRLTRAAAALRMGLGTVAEVAEQVGYSSPFHFSRAFKAHFGCSPSAYLRTPTAS